LVKKFIKLMLNGYLGVTTFKRGHPSYIGNVMMVENLCARRPKPVFSPLSVSFALTYGAEPLRAVREVPCLEARRGEKMVKVKE